MQSQADFGTLIVPLRIQVTQGVGTEFEEDIAHLQQLSSRTFAPGCNGDPDDFCPTMRAWVRCMKNLGWTPKIHS